MEKRISEENQSTTRARVYVLTWVGQDGRASKRTTSYFEDAIAWYERAKQEKGTNFQLAQRDTVVTTSMIELDV